MTILRRCRRILRLRLGKERIPRLDCMHPPSRVIDLPDPFLYSQFYLRTLGLPVTWDNPDIRILADGQEVYTYDLLPDTEYRAEITVHNNSAKPAPDTRVQASWLEFGVGGSIAASHPICDRAISLPSRGQPGEPAKVLTTWRTPTEPGHYCIEVQLSHPMDGNSGNNRGWNNTVVKRARPGQAVLLDIPVWNAFPVAGYASMELQGAASQVQLRLDSYTLRLPPEEGDRGVESFFGHVAARWNAEIDRTALRLQPGHGPENAALRMTVPAEAPVGTCQLFNVSGAVKGRPVGGVTLIVQVEEG